MKYGGIHFYMAREGEFEQYRSFNIPKEQEFLWIQEYEKERLKEVETEDIVDVNFFRLCDAISAYDDIYYLEEMHKLIKRKTNSMDSFSLMLMAEGLLRIVESFSKKDMKDHQITLLTKDFALKILASILEKPITIASYYKQPEYLFDPVDEEHLIVRVKNKISCWR